SGKTTMPINLPSYLATRRYTPVLMDFDPQGSTLRWVRKRRPAQAPIHAIAAFEKDSRTTRAFQLRVPDVATHVIVDTPAALDPRQLSDMTRDADKILVPVLPSDIDIHACSRCIRDLLLVAKISRDENRIGVIANRIRRNTLTYQSLIRFLHTLGIPIVATIRDSQNYVRGAAGAVVRSPGIPDLVGPVLVVGPGVEVAGYRSLAGACALHAIQPARVRFRARRRTVARGRRVALRAGRLVSAPVARAHEVKLLMTLWGSVRCRLRAPQELVHRHVEACARWDAPLAAPRETVPRAWALCHRERERARRGHKARERAFRLPAGKPGGRRCPA